MATQSRSVAAARRQFRVLIVDHEESDRTFLDSVLRQPGHETAVAADGIEATKIAETRGPFDLLVTDVVLPGMQGDELARRLRRTNPEIKILYLTEHSSRLFEERTSLWDGEAFLDKPVTARGLLEAVSLILVGRIPAPRAVRVRIPGAHVRFANRVANLVTLSATGVLVHVDQELPAGSRWRLTIDLPSETIRVTGRVVRCHLPKPTSSDGAPLETQPPYAVAMAFVGPSAGVRRALQRVVQQVHRG